MVITSKKGFTLIEVLLVIGLLAILASITIVAINPSRQFAKARDSQRVSDVYSILSAIHQYSLDNEEAFPEAISTEEGEICKTGNITCTSLTNLSVLTMNEQYLQSLPVDPMCSDGVNQYCSEGGTGYYVKLTENGRITVSSQNIELSEPLFVTK